MRNSKHGPRALVLAITAALGVMAFAVTGAQAQTHNEKLHTASLHEPTLNPEKLEGTGANTLGTYLINLSTALLATVTATQVGEGSLLVAGRNLEIKCSELDLNAGKITSSTHGEGAATFLGCAAFEHTTLNPLPCEFVELKTVKAEALVLPILHGPTGAKENFLLFEPANLVTNFTIIEFKPGECPLPLKNPVTGSVSALVHALDAVTQLILFSEGVQLLTGDILRFGGFPSYIKAHGNVSLTGDHATQKLGIH